MFVIFALASFLSCNLFGGSLQQSKEPDDRQQVNFCGLLRTEANAEPRMIENIGMPSYKNIKFYAKPTKQGQKPSDDEYIGKLAEISRIERIAETTIHNRPYIEIRIVFNDGAKSERTFVVEANRRLTYHEIIDGKVIPRNTKFSAIESLEIKGHFERNEATKEEDGKRCKMLLKNEEAAHASISNERKL